LAYDLEKDIREQEEKGRDDSLTKLRRDRGKMEEIFGSLTVALEKRGGGVEHLFALLSGADSAPDVDIIADYLMGVREMTSIDPFRIVTETGKSDRVRAKAVQDIPADELPWEMCLDHATSAWSRTRINIVKRLTDQSKLKAIALKGGRWDSAVAADKLTNNDDLVEVALSSFYNTTVFVALDHLPEAFLHLVIDQTKHVLPKREILVAAVARISDRKKLFELRAVRGNEDLFDATGRRLVELRALSHSSLPTRRS